MIQEPHDYLTIDEIAALLRVTRHTVRALIRDGLPAAKVGSIFRIARSDLDAWIAKAKEKE